jgi:arylsulfatase A-like enzyme
MTLKPNIVIITCHDLGIYLGCYGTPVKTPNIDALAAQGVCLTNHFAPASTCSPSRGSLWTGCYPHTHELMGLAPRGWELNVDKCPPLPVLLREYGYQSHLFGLQHEHWDPIRLGYDVIHPVDSTFCDDVTPVFTGWLKTRVDNSQAFLANVGVFETHRIGLASQGYSDDLLGSLPSHFKRDVYDTVDSNDVTVPQFMLDTPEQRRELADFYSAVQFLDKQVGNILDTLDYIRQAENTLLVFVTDHGASFLHSKGTLYDGGVKVACLMRWPGILPPGQEVTSLTSHVDIVPTILEVLDLPIPEHIQGQSFIARTQNKPGSSRRYVFSEKNYTQYFDPARMVRSESYKYIRNGFHKCIFDFVLTEIELSPTSFRNNKEVFRFYSSKRCIEELYDLESDPAEMKNIVQDPSYFPVLEEMRAVLDTHLQETNDPFRDMRIDLHMPVDVYADAKDVRDGEEKRAI